MTRVVLSTALILEAAERGRLTLGPLGVQLDGRDVDDHGGQEVIDLLNAGHLANVADGRIIVPASGRTLNDRLDAFFAKYRSPAVS